jgi:hypothetical protein
MTNMIRRATQAIRGTAGGAAIYVSGKTGVDLGRLFVDRGTDGESSREVIRTQKVLTKTASFSLTAEDDGAIVILDSTTAIVATLPSTAKGMQFTFLVKQLPGAGVHAISPAAADKIFGPGLTAADNKDLQASAAADAVGDFVTLTGDGADGWFITAIGEATPDNWAREA